jgi:pimeloyl-ACP methyl ester carboxylesterase
VVGHDWAAALAWVFASVAPAPVDHLVALSVGHPAALAGVEELTEQRFAVARRFVAYLGAIVAARRPRTRRVMSSTRRFPAAAARGMACAPGRLVVHRSEARPDQLDVPVLRGGRGDLMRYALGCRSSRPKRNSANEQGILVFTTMTGTL